MTRDELESLSFIVAMVTGIIGCILGIIGFVKSVKTEKKVLHEPYFKNIWRVLSQRIKEMEDDIRYHKHNLTLFFENYTKHTPLVPIEGAGSPVMKRNYNIEKYDFTYDKRIKMLYDRNISKIRSIDELIHQYNEDWYYASPDIYFDLQIMALQFPGEKESKIGQRNERGLKILDELKRRLQTYYERETVDNLRLSDNAKYMSDLKKLKEQIVIQVNSLTIDRKLTDLKNFYDLKFSG